MKRLLFLALMLASFTSSAWAGRAAHFNGWYQILSPASDPAHYLLIDADTLGNIWERRADGPLPADLEDLRNEPSILAAFTSPQFLILTLERNSLIGDRHMAVTGGNGDRLEIAKRPDGNYDVAILSKGVLSRFLMAPPKENPEIR